MDAVIATERLTKRFGRTTVVDGLSLQVKKGEIYGFVGLNGAGKTTTIRMLLGMIRPTRGRAFVMGQAVHARQHRLWADVGYMVETPRSYPELTVAQNLEIVCRLRGVVDAAAKDDVLHLLGLMPYRNKKAGILSLGNKQRLGLAKALIHKPAVLILDEPTNGLDPAGIVEVRQLLRRLAADDGVTIFLSSHLLSEVARLITRLGIIHQGRLVKEIDSDALQKDLRRKLAIQTRDVQLAKAVLQRAGYDVHVSGGEIPTMFIDDARAVQRPDDVARILVAGDVPPTRLYAQEEDLETYFLRAVEGGGRHANADRGIR